MSRPSAASSAEVTDGHGAGAATTAPAAGRAAVVLDGVARTYRARDGRETAALGPVDLRLDEGSLVTLVGPSGCGKSTLLRLVAGFETPTEGAVAALDDDATLTPVDGPSPARGVVFQRANLFPWLTVAGNVEYGPRVRGVPRARRREIVDEHLALVGLSDFARHRPYELSGGMQQRAQIARVLAARPSIVLMDEPFGALDALTRARLQDELRALWAEQRTTILFVTHSVDEAVHLGTRVLVMSDRPGRIVADLPVPAHGSSPEDRDAPELLALRHEVTRLLTTPTAAPAPRRTA